MLKQNTDKEKINIHQEILFLAEKLIFVRSPPIYIQEDALPLSNSSLVSQIIRVQFTEVSEDCREDRKLNDLSYFRGKNGQKNNTSASKCFTDGES